MGKDGQYIINFPYLDLIIVSTTKKDITWEKEQEIPTLEIVSEYILKAIQKVQEIQLTVLPCPIKGSIDEIS